MHYFEVTNDEDPFFLYTLSVTEDEFTHLKHEQRIHVDFSAFPENCINLLDRCCKGGTGAGVDEAPTLWAERRRGAGRAAVSLGGSAPGGAGDAASESSAEGDLGHSRYLAVLTTASGSGASRLDVVETNRFKELTHLSLTLQAGTDAGIKHYLAARLALAESQAAQLRTELERSDAGGSQRASEIERLNSHLATLEAEMKAEASRRDEMARADLAALREEHAKATAEQAAAHQAELNAMTARAQEQVSQLSRQTKEQAATIAELTGEREKLAHRLDAANRELSSVTAEVEAHRSELAELRTTNRDQAAALARTEVALREATARRSALEQQISDREEVSGRTRELLEAANAQSASLEESLGLYKASHTKLQEKLEASIAEINKGNSIIRGLQADHRALKNKVRMKAAVVRQQEELIAEKERALADKDREITALSNELDRERSAKGSTSAALEASEAKLRAQREQLARDKEVIAFLNKEITDLQMQMGPRATGVGGGTGGLGGTSFTASPASGPSTAYQFKPSTVSPSAGGGGGGSAIKQRLGADYSAYARKRDGEGDSGGPTSLYRSALFGEEAGSAES